MTMATSYSDHEAVAQQLIAMGKKYGVTTPDLLFDLYNMFKNKGASLDHDPETLEALRVQDPIRYWISRDELHKQSVLIRDIQKSPLFQALLTMDPLAAVEEICKNCQLAYQRMEAADKTAQRSANGHQGDASLGGPEYAEARQQHAQQMMQQNKQPQEFSLTNLADLISAMFGGIKEPSALPIFGASKVPYSLIVGNQPKPSEAQWIIQAARQFSQRGGAQFWKWVANVAGSAGFEEKGPTDTDVVTDDSKQDQMQRVEDITAANPADLQRPDFDKQVVDRSIVVTKHTADAVEKAHAVVLLDVSGSMSSADCAGGRIDRALYALVVIVAMMQKVIQRGDVFHLMPFECQALPMMTASNTEEAVNIIDKLFSQTRWGGGTCIETAIMAGIEAVKQVGQYRHADIVLITDGEDSLNVQRIRDSLPPKCKLRGIHITGTINPEVGEQMVDVCDSAVAAKWDEQNDMPELDGVLKGV